MSKPAEGDEMKDAVKTTVIERLEVLQALADRLARRLEAADAPGMMICRIAVDADHAAALLADHANRLETPR